MLIFAKLELGNSWFVLLLVCALKKLFEISQLASAGLIICNQSVA